MKTYEVKLKMKLPNYPKWIIAHIEEGLEQGEAVVEYDITKIRGGEADGKRT